MKRVKLGPDPKAKEVPASTTYFRPRYLIPADAVGRWLPSAACLQATRAVYSDHAAIVKHEHTGNIMTLAQGVSLGISTSVHSQS